MISELVRMRRIDARVNTFPEMMMGVFGQDEFCAVNDSTTQQEKADPRAIVISKHNA